MGEERRARAVESSMLTFTLTTCPFQSISSSAKPPVLTFSLTLRSFYLFKTKSTDSMAAAAAAAAAAATGFRDALIEHLQ